MAPRKQSDSDAKATEDAPAPAPATEVPDAYTSAQERYEQPATDEAGRELGPFESTRTPNPADSVSTDDRYVRGTETVLMRGDQPASDTE